MADRRTGACSSAFAALFILLAISSKIYAHTITPKCDLHGKRPVEGLTNFTWNMFKPLGQFTTRRKPSKGTMITSAFRKHRTFVSIIPGLLLLCGDIISQPGPAANAGLRHSSIKCLGINARSIKSTHKVGSAIVCNSERVQDLAYSENADIVFINETWLNSSISNEEVFHSGYTIYRRDRNDREGGGVLIAAKSDSFKAIKEWKPDMTLFQDLEVVSAELTTSCNRKVLFSSFYWPDPDSDPYVWLEKFNNYLDYACDSFDTMLISGDFNMSKFSWASEEQSLGARELSFTEILNDHYLSQMNHFPTRGDKILDLVITNASDQVCVNEVLSPNEAGVFSDHGVVCFEFSAFVKAPSKFHRSVYNYTKADFDGLRASLSALELTMSSNENSDIDTDWQNWKDLFLAAVADHVPSKKLRGRNPVPWMNGTILDLIKKKETTRRRLKKTPAKASLREKFKALRAEVKQALRESRENFFQSLERDYKNNTKRFWFVLKQKSKSRGLPSQVSMATVNPPTGSQDPTPLRTTADDPEAIANLFNKYFASVFLKDSLQDLNTDPEHCAPPVPELSNISFDINDISVIRGLDASKASGPDNIPVRLLKETAAVIAPSLCQIFNKSIKLGKFPSEWKIAHIVPVYKKDSAQQVENYRPISLLSVVSKIMERCVFNKIRERVHCLIQRCQHGFIAGRSCVTQLVEVLDTIGSHLDNGNQIDVVYLDMSKAFDRVSHRMLTRKLVQYGFGGNLLKWFTSYITNRSQRVAIPGGVSTCQPVTSGVPQGSILGPILFVLFANDLPDSVCSCSVATFADDTKVFNVINSADDTDVLQSDLNSLNGWAASTGMTFNQTKSKVMRVSRKRKPVLKTYSLGGLPLACTETEKDLGVWMSDDLSWTKQVDEACSKANRTLGSLSPSY
ncbi:uncharacterized protein LOC116614508 [Nematostella vectensis]|uniref:uncharacterized protein LOC116614508 n=1 Tax=Nematostella vectensis TaxID=45351 RepID=UPI00207703F9|nr:uncharacterized protein LOC116614508 [Nematostella vectensis]